MSSNKKNFVNTVCIALGAVISAFLVWFIYFKPEASSSYEWVSSLPLINASLNSLAAIFLTSGYIFIKKKNEKVHIVCMSLALASSAVFLVSYLTYHHFHGDTKFVAQGDD